MRSHELTHVALTTFFSANTSSETSPLAKAFFERGVKQNEPADRTIRPISRLLLAC